MFEMLTVQKRSTILFAFGVYMRWLRLQPGKLVTVPVANGGSVPRIDRAHEITNVAVVAEEFNNNFVYVSDEIYDRSRLYIEGVEKQPAFLILLTELSTLVNKAICTDNHVDDADPHLSTIDVDGTKRMREIVQVLNAGGEDKPVDQQIEDKYATTQTDWESANKSLDEQDIEGRTD